MFRFFRVTGAIALLLSTLSIAQHPAHATESKTNLPTVVCLGDSITRSGYPAELEKMLPIRVINAGINGNNSRQGLARLDRDVLAHKPDAVLIFFGTNDNRQDSLKAHVPLPEYEKNLRAIVSRCQSAGARVILGTMPPIDPEPYFTRHDKEKFDTVGGLEKLVAEYREAAMRVARSQRVPVVDLNRLLADEPKWLSADGVHPTAEGNRIIAKLFSKEVKSLLAQPK